MHCGGWKRANEISETRHPLDRSFVVDGTGDRDGWRGGGKVRRGKEGSFQSAILFSIFLPQVSLALLSFPSANDVSKKSFFFVTSVHKRRRRRKSSWPTFPPPLDVVLKWSSSIRRRARGFPLSRVRLLLFFKVLLHCWSFPPCWYTIFCCIVASTSMSLVPHVLALAVCLVVAVFAAVCPFLSTPCSRN